MHERMQVPSACASHSDIVVLFECADSRVCAFSLRTCIVATFLQTLGLGLASQGLPSRIDLLT